MRDVVKYNLWQFGLHIFTRARFVEYSDGILSPRGKRKRRKTP